jgi:hypothetical protein
MSLIGMDGMSGSLSGEASADLGSSPLASSGLSSRYSYLYFYFYAYPSSFAVRPGEESA